MDILIIGNGFDLAHGLKTSYGEFLDFCKNLKFEDESEQYSDYKHCLEKNLWMKHFITRQNQLGNTWIDLENEIYEVIKFLKSQFIFDKYRDSSLLKMNKILEIEKYKCNFQLQNIHDYLRDAYSNDNLSKDGIEPFFKYDMIGFYLENSQDLINLLHRHLIEFTHLFEKYLLEEVFANPDHITT